MAAGPDGSDACRWRSPCHGALCSPSSGQQSRWSPCPPGADATGGLTVSPSSVHAGAHPTLDVNLQFAPEANDSARTAVVALARGRLLNFGARPACLTGAIDPTPTCEIGTSSARLRLVGLWRGGCSVIVVLVCVLVLSVSSPGRSAAVTLTQAQS